MSMSKEDFKKALREEISSDFSLVPDDDENIEYDFSEHFDKKADKLIKAQKKSYYFLINNALKRAAIIIVTFLALFAATTRVDVVNGTVTNIIVEIYENISKKIEEEKPKEDIVDNTIPVELPELTKLLLRKFHIKERMRESLSLDDGQTWYPVQSSLKNPGGYVYILAGCWEIWNKEGIEDLTQIQVRVLNQNPEVISRAPYVVLPERTGVHKIYLREGCLSDTPVFFEFKSGHSSSAGAVVEYYTNRAD